MADIPASNWNATDASNTTAAPDGMPEGMAPSGVNDWGRAVMGAVKRWYNWTIPATTAGTTTAFTLTYTPAPGALVDGMSHLVLFNATCGANPTLNVNSLGAKALHKYSNGAWGAVASGDLAINSIHRVTYNLGADVYRITSGPPLGAAFLALANTFTALITMSGAAINMAKGADVASVAGTTDIGAATGNYIDVTGTNTPTGLGTVQAGTHRIVNFTGALLLTHNATSLILPGGANITTAAGDVAAFVSLGSGNWRCVAYQKASAAPVTLSPITNSLGADVALNNTGSYFTGPSIAQSTAGVWFVSGTITATSGGVANINAKLWDGTTVVDSGRSTVSSANEAVAISLSGFISAPTGNLRISVNDATRTDGSIKYDFSGNAKDSTLTAIRIA